MRVIGEGRLDALAAAEVDVNGKIEGLPQSTLEFAAITCAGNSKPPEVTTHIMNTLIKAGDNLNTEYIAGLGPLMIAAQQCKSEVIKVLVAAGAKLDSNPPQGYTPLVMAVITSNEAGAEALVESGAKLTLEGAAKLLAMDPNNAKLKASVDKAATNP